MVICASSRSPILIGMKSPVSPRGATDEPYGSQRRAGNPAYPAQMTAGQGIGGANHGSQCPLTPPGLSATARGESAGGGSPPDFLRPVQTPDSCLGVKGSRARLQSLPSFTQAFFAQAFFTFDFIPQTLPSLFGPVDRAGPAACVRDYAAGTRRCRLLGRAVRGVGWGRSRSSAAKCRRCDRVLDPFGQPLPGTGAPRVLGSCAAQCLAVLVAQRPSGWPAAAFRAGCHSACTSPRLLRALATLCACLSVCLTAVFAPLRADTRVRREMRQTVRRSLLRLCLRV